MNQYLMPETLSVSPLPHVKTLDSVRSVMIDVIIALMPATVWGVYRFGVKALLIVLMSVASAVLSEAVCRFIMKKPQTAGDLSAVVTGLILGLSMPSGVGLWIPVIGSVFAIVAVKELFGGLGKNIVNPAICARVFLMLTFPGEMTKYVNIKTDLVSSATSLVSLKAGVVPETNLFNSILGNISGAVGEVSVIALAAGFVYLFCRKVVRWEIPVTFVGVVGLFVLLFPITGDNPTSLAHELCSGSLIFAACFAANDWTTTPVTRAGRLMFGAGCGIITVLIRYYGAYPDGTAFAILLMNLAVPLLDKAGNPVPFGKRKVKGGNIQ